MGGKEREEEEKDEEEQEEEKECTLPGEKPSSEQLNFWACSQKVVRINEIARSVIVTCVCSTSLQQLILGGNSCYMLHCLLMNTYVGHDSHACHKTRR